MAVADSVGDWQHNVLHLMGTTLAMAEITVCNTDNTEIWKFRYTEIIYEYLYEYSM